MFISLLFSLLLEQMVTWAEVAARVLLSPWEKAAERLLDYYSHYYFHQQEATASDGKVVESAEAKQQHVYWGWV